MSMTPKLLLGIAGGMLAATAVFAASMHDDRSALMKSMGGKAGPLFGMMQEKMPYDAAVATAAAQELAAIAKTDFAPLFPEGDTEGRALPIIWEQWDDFNAKHDALIAATETLAAEAGNGLDALKAAIGPVGAACGACHEVYRKPE
jgi:cytochrome c556